jgi:hypothetical protein
MADQSMSIRIGTSFIGEGVAKAINGMGKLGKAASSSAATVGKLAGSFGDLDNAASKAIGSVGNLMTAFATGGAIGIAATAITTVVAALQEMKKEAEEAAKVRFDNQIKGLQYISESADKATESYKKLAKQVDDFKNSLLGIKVADINQALTTKEIEQEKKRLNGDKVGAAETGVRHCERRKRRRYLSQRRRQLKQPTERTKQ